MNHRHGRGIAAWGFILIFVLGVVLVAGYNILWLNSKGTWECTVDSKERTVKVQDGNSTQQKLVYTDCGAFEVQDALVLGKFNSADTYASLQEGETYELTTYGWRNGFLSLFPNITEAVPVNG